MDSTLPKHYDNTFGLREGAEKFPLMVVLSMTYACNAKCKSCPYRKKFSIRQRYKAEMALHISPAVFEAVADECGKHNAILRLTGGGEPLMHPDAWKMIDYAMLNNSRVSLITNGSFMTEKAADKYIPLGIYAIEFSVDAGTKEEYKEVRNGLDWKHITEIVPYCKKVRDESHSNTKIIVSIINQKGVDVERARAYWSDKCDVVQVRKFLTWGYNDPDGSADATPYLPPSERIPCPWLFERINVDTQGDVTYCGEDIAFTNKFANVLDRRIEDIWTGPEMTAARKAHLERRGDSLPMCAKCPDWQYRSWNHNYWKMVKP
jgi:MoaA/NifB/PqqE/SkfB family radical SAM enzyme